MSKYVANQSCKLCHKIEKALCTMTVGDTKHHICYDCMPHFVLDLVEFAEHNLREEMSNLGVEIKVEEIDKRNGN